MPARAIQQKIVQLTELLNNPHRNEGSVLRVYYELFKLSHEGRDLSLDTVEWLNESVSLFLSPPLVNVLTKLRLEVYGFKFAALNFIDIDDVIDDLLNGEILKSVHSLPPGAFNKLKSQLLEPPPPRPQPQSQSKLEKTPHQQPARRNYFATPSSTSSSASTRGDNSDEWDEGVEEDPYSDEIVPQKGRLKGVGGFYKKRKDPSVARSAFFESIHLCLHRPATGLKAMATRLRTSLLSNLLSTHSLRHSLSLRDTRTTSQEWYHSWMELSSALQPEPFGGMIPMSVPG